MQLRLVVFGPGHPFRGGIASTTTELVKALVDRGHDIVFATPRRQYPQWLYPGKGDRDPDVCEQLSCAQTWLDPLNPMSWMDTKSRALEFGADAWIVPYWTWAWAGLWLSLLRSSHRPPIIGIVHNLKDHGAHIGQRWAATAVLGRCNALFTHAEVLAEDLRSDYPGLLVSQHPLAIGDAGRLPDREAARTSLGWSHEGRVALFLGFIRPYKGVDLLIDALAGVPEGADWRLVVAGEAWGDLGEALKKQVRELGLEKRVELRLGWVAEDDVSSLLAACDLVVLPYRSGSQSAVAPKVLAHGVPVLSTAVGGLAEVIRPGVNGMLVEPGSAEALSQALQELDDETLKCMAAQASTSVAHLSWASYAAKLENLITAQQRLS